MCQILTKAEFARTHGVKPTAVSNWIARGHLTAPALRADGTIDVALAEEQLGKRIKPVYQAAAMTRSTPSTSAADAGDLAWAPSQQASLQLLKARALTASVEAERKRRELMAERGRYMPAAGVEAAWACTLSAFLTDVVCLACSHGDNLMNISADLQHFDRFNQLRMTFLNNIAQKHISFASQDERPSVVIVTHLLPDRPIFISVLSEYFRISPIFGIPYSTDRDVTDWVRTRFPFSEPTLQELLEGDCIATQLAACSNSNVLLFEIGGYAANVIDQVAEDLGGRLTGVIEGTESGYLRYSAVVPRQTPIVCMSLSPVKWAESALVGQACMFSVDRILRKLGFTNEMRNVAVLGYGRVGKSAAEAARGHGLTVSVFDAALDRRLQALADGFLIPDRSEIFRNADLILAATGRNSWSIEDANITRNGAFLVSCSSKDVEFDFANIKSAFPTEQISSEAHAVNVGDRVLRFIYEGRPVNFSDGANLGPLLTLLQGEMIAVCGDLLRKRYGPGVQSPAPATRASVIQEWFDRYIDSTAGWYKKRTF